MLIPEYKRDINRNYLILPFSPDCDPDAYQNRMLLTHAVPGLLHCTIQNVDACAKLYYDITSRCSVKDLYEEKQVHYDDLRLIFGGFIAVMEGLAEYLMNPDTLILDPAYLYADADRSHLYFCCLPGYDTEIRQQFQKLTEYLLPKLDHRDAKGVMLGYGIYRRALEDSFHLEHIKEELYRPAPEQEGPVRDFGTKDFSEDGSRSAEHGPRLTIQDFDPQPSERKEASLPLSPPPWVQEEAPVSSGSSRRSLLIGILSAAIVLSVLLVTALLKQMGYFPGLSTELLLGLGALALAIGTLAGLLIRKIQNRKGEKGEGKTPKGKDHIQIESHDPKACKGERKKPPENPARAPRTRREDPFSLALEGLSEERKREQMIPEPWPSAETAEPEHKASRRMPEGEHRPSRGMSNPDRGRREHEDCQETMVLTAAHLSGPAALISREPGALPTIYLTGELTVVGKLETAADAVIDLPTVSRLHAKIRREKDQFLLSDLNSKNGTTVNGHLLSNGEQWVLNDQDEVDFASARYLFVK